MENRPPEIEVLRAYHAALCKVAREALKVSQFIRPRGLGEQLEAMEKVHRLAWQMQRAGNLDIADCFLIRDVIFTLRLLMRACCDHEFENNDQLIEYLAAELAAENQRGEKVIGMRGET